MKLLRANHKIDMRQIFQQFRAARLSHAAEETENHVRPFFRHATEHSHFPQRLLVGHIAHAAGVQEHDVGFHLVRDAFVASCHERVRDLFRVALVHLTTVGLDEKLRHGRAKIIHVPAAFAMQRLCTFHQVGSCD